MAFLRSDPPREPFLKAPASVLSLIGILVAAHIARISVTAALSERIVETYAFVPARYAPNALEAGSLFDRVVPFVSYIFLHADFTHLVMNCLWLLAFGPVVARRFGTVLFLFFFVVCGVAAAGIHLLFNWGSPEAVIGASGAISGLMAAGIRSLGALAPREIGVRPGLLPLLAPQVLVFSALWIVMNTVFGLTGIPIAGETHAVAWQAHLGGYFVGLLLAGPLDRWAAKSDTD